MKIRIKENLDNTFKYVWYLKHQGKVFDACVASVESGGFTRWVIFDGVPDVPGPLFVDSNVAEPVIDVNSESYLKAQAEITKAICNDPVDHPAHYTTGTIEVINFIEDKQLNYHRGNAVKHIARAGIKDKKKEVGDLEKAIWYLRREIERLKREPVQEGSVKPVQEGSVKPITTIP